MSGTKDGPGFTLIELVITTLIIGILAGALIPFSLKAVNKSELESAAKMIVSDIRYGENKALSQQWDLFKIEFVPGENEYRTYFDKNDIGAYEAVKMPKRVTLSRVKFGGSEKEVQKLYFSMKGTVLAGGTVSLHDETGNWLYVKVTPVTGRVKISKINN